MAFAALELTLVICCVRDVKLVPDPPRDAPHDAPSSKSTRNGGDAEAAAPLVPSEIGCKAAAAEVTAAAAAAAALKAPAEATADEGLEVVERREGYTVVKLRYPGLRALCGSRSPVPAEGGSATATRPPKYSLFKGCND